MSDRTYEPMTKAEVVEAQREWARCIIEQDIDGLLELYDFGTPEEPLLFKPTLADVIRLDRAGALSYFLGGDRRHGNHSSFHMISFNYFPEHVRLHGDYCGPSGPVFL